MRYEGVNFNEEAVKVLSQEDFVAIHIEAFGEIGIGNPQEDAHSGIWSDHQTGSGRKIGSVTMTGRGNTPPLILWYGYSKSCKYHSKDSRRIRGGLHRMFVEQFRHSAACRYRTDV